MWDMRCEKEDDGLEDCGLLIADCGIKGFAIWDVRKKMIDYTCWSNGVLE